MSVELWKEIFDWAAVVLVGFTFIAGAGALITGKILNDRQSEQLRQFGRDLTTAKKELTTAQTKLAEEQRRASEAQLKLDQWLAKRVIARTVLPQDFEPLKKFPAAKVQVWYKDGDGEAFMYAQSMLQSFKAIGWDAPAMALSTRKHPMPNNGGVPIIGTYVVAKHGEEDFMKKGGTFMPFPSTAPFKADSRLATLMAVTGAQSFAIDPTMRDGTFRIVVGEYLKWWLP